VRRPRSLAALFALVVITAAATGGIVASTGSSAREWPSAVDVGFGSDALRDEIGLRVYLPPDYTTTTKRYPVVYFLHGLPASPVAYRNTAFLRRAMTALGRDAIVVAVQGARDGEPDTEYLDSGPGRNWETAVAVEVPRFVDGRFRTIRSRRGRAIVGVSAGGYGAMLLGLHHLGEFSAIESWSGYFHPTDPTGNFGLDLGSVAKNARASAHSFIGGLSRSFARNPTFLAFYVGTDDGRFRAENEQLDRELMAAHVLHLFRIYPGAHVQSLWMQHAPAWLGLALDHLAAAR
jgi:S-formylglutathione hydrolase FrmB